MHRRFLDDATQPHCGGRHGLLVGAGRDSDTVADAPNTVDEQEDARGHRGGAVGLSSRRGDDTDRRDDPVVDVRLERRLSNDPDHRCDVEPIQKKRERRRGVAEDEARYYDGCRPPGYGPHGCASD